jgi:hypothetical protein
MSDETEFLSLCERFGVNLKKKEHETQLTIDRLKEIAVSYTIEAHEGPKQVGYGMFVSDWYFDRGGAFIGVGNWE